MKLFKSLILSLNLLFAWPSFATPECAGLLAKLSDTHSLVVVQHQDAYEGLLKRLPPESQTELGPAFEQLVVAFKTRGHQIDDPMLEGFFLRGVLLSAKTVQDIQRAAQVFSLAEPDERRNPHLNFFAARMAIYNRTYAQSQSKYPNTDPHLAAVAELVRFDRVNKNMWKTDFDPATGRIKVVPLASQTLAKLKSRGLNVAETAPGGFQFNHGREFALDHSHWQELLAAQQVAREQPEETLIGLDDPGVRNFFPYLRLGNGTFRRPQGENAADFLSVRRNPTDNSQVQFIVRELKFSDKENDVDVKKAMVQIVSTIKNLEYQNFGVPVAFAEILVPRRTKQSLGRGYRTSPDPIPDSDNVFELQDRLGSPVVVGSPQVPIRVRHIDPFP